MWRTENETYTFRVTPFLKDWFFSTSSHFTGQQRKKGHDKNVFF